MYRGVPLMDVTNNVLVDMALAKPKSQSFTTPAVCTSEVMCEQACCRLDSSQVHHVLPWSLYIWGSRLGVGRQGDSDNVQMHDKAVG